MSRPPESVRIGGQRKTVVGLLVVSMAGCQARPDAAAVDRRQAEQAKPDVATAERLCRSGDLTGARAALDRAAAVAPRDAGVLVRRGYVLGRLGLDGAAQRDFKAAQELAPRRAAAYVGEAELAKAAAAKPGERDGFLLLDMAVNRYATAAALEPTNPMILYGHATAQYERSLVAASTPFTDQGDRYEVVVRDLDQVIAVRPRFAPAYVLRGLARSHTGHATTPQCCADLDQAIAIDPRSAEAHYVRGSILADTGNADDRTAAAADAAQASRLAPADPKYRAAAADWARPAWSGATIAKVAFGLALLGAFAGGHDGAASDGGAVPFDPTPPVDSSGDLWMHLMLDDEGG